MYQDHKNALFLWVRAIVIFQFEAIAWLTIFHFNRNLKSASMENVTGLLNRGRGHEEYLKTYVSSLVGLGMDVRVSILDSSR